MSKRLEYQEVKEEFSKQGYTLLSETYKNIGEKLKVKCPEGHVWYTSFHNFKSGNRCFECTNKDKNVNRKYTYEEVKSFIESEGYRLISSDYQNNRTKLDIICPEGHEYKVSLHDFKAGYRCQICSDKRRGIVERKDYSEVKEWYKNNFSFNVNDLSKKNRHDLYKSLVNYVGIEGKDYVECKVCGKRSKNINIRHLKSWHNLTKEEYLEIYPDALLYSESKSKIQSKIASGNKGRTGKKNSLEQNKIISERQKGKGNSFYGKTHSKETMKIAVEKRKKTLLKKYGVENPAQIPSVREKLSIVNKERYKKGFKNWNEGLTKETNESLKIQSEKLKEWHSKNDTWNKGLTKHDDERLLHISECSKLQSKNLDFTKYRIKCWREKVYNNKEAFYKWRKKVDANVVPNKLETYFDLITSEDVYFVGDGTLYVTLKDGSKKNPDFKVHGQRKFIELFGDYWHKNENPELLIQKYKEIGFDCIIFWESEIKKMSKEDIKKIVDNFIQGAVEMKNGY